MADQTPNPAPQVAAAAPVCDLTRDAPPKQIRQSDLHSFFKPIPRDQWEESRKMAEEDWAKSMEEVNERRAERKRKQKEEADAVLAAKRPVGRPRKPIPLAPPVADGGDDAGGDADSPRGKYKNWKTPEFFPFIIDQVRRFKEVPAAVKFLVRNHSHFAALKVSTIQGWYETERDEKGARAVVNG